MFHNNFKFNNFLPKTIPKYALLRLWTCSNFDKRGNSKSWNKWVTCLSWNKSDVMHTTYISKAMAQTKSIPYPRPSLWHGFFPLCIFIVPRSELNLGNGRWCRNWHGAYMSWVVVFFETPTGDSKMASSPPWMGVSKSCSRGKGSSWMVSPPAEVWLGHPRRWVAERLWDWPDC